MFSPKTPLLFIDFDNEINPIFMTDKFVEYNKELIKIVKKYKANFEANYSQIKQLLIICSDNR